MIYDWKFIDRKKIFSKEFINIWEDTYNNGLDTIERSFFIIDLPDWVNIVAITEDKQVVLIRQFRFGTGGFHYEIPGGAVDKTDSSGLHSAKRELLEETGYGEGEWKHIGTISPNPAIQSNKCRTYLAKNVRKIKGPSFDENEDIEIMLAGPGDIDNMVRNGKIDHSLVICAFYFADRFLNE